MLIMLKELCELTGVASFEDEVRSYLSKRVEPYADGLRTDAMGNLIAFKKGRRRAENHLLLTAHMDEAGLIIRDITDEGYLKFSPVGPLDGRVAIGKRVSVGWNHLPGVIGLKAYHLVSDEEEKQVPKLSDMYIDIGAREKKEAEELVAKGDFAAFTGGPEEFGAGLLKARGLDSRVGCAILLKLLEEDLPIDCTFVFTVQEGVGMRGAFGAAFSVAPRTALVVGGVPAADVPKAEEMPRLPELGKGPVLSVMDGGTLYDRPLFERIRALAAESKMPWQLKYAAFGGSDAAAVQRTRAGVRVAALGVPVRYLRCPSGLISLADFEQTYTLTKKTVEALAAV